MPRSVMQYLNIGGALCIGQHDCAIKIKEEMAVVSSCDGGKPYDVAAAV